MGGVVYIPVQNSEEEVMVALDHLPRDATDMIDILKAEQAPLHLWLIIAVGSPSSIPVYFPLFLLCSVVRFNLCNWTLVGPFLEVSIISSFVGIELVFLTRLSFAVIDFSCFNFFVCLWLARN